MAEVLGKVVTHLCCAYQQAIELVTGGSLRSTEANIKDTRVLKELNQSLLCIYPYKTSLRQLYLLYCEDGFSKNERQGLDPTLFNMVDDGDDLDKTYTVGGFIELVSNVARACNFELTFGTYDEQIVDLKTWLKTMEETVQEKAKAMPSEDFIANACSICYLKLEAPRYEHFLFRNRFDSLLHFYGRGVLGWATRGR